MKKNKVDDPLPEGWIVTFTVRKDGTKDKYYSCPSTGVTLRSRIGVHRYVNNIPSPSKRKGKAAWRRTPKVVGKKVVAERLPPGLIKTVKAAEMNGRKEGLPPGLIKTVKAAEMNGRKEGLPPGLIKTVKVAEMNGRKEGLPPGLIKTVKATKKDGRKEGLPPGWIKTEKVTEKDGGKVRTDKYYKSPGCTHVFRSMKEVVHYLETGEFGRKRRKRILQLEYKGSNDADLEDATETSKSPTIAKKRNLKAGQAKIKITKEQALKLREMLENDERDTLADSTSCISMEPDINSLKPLKASVTKRKKLKLPKKKNLNGKGSYSAAEGKWAIELRRSEPLEDTDLKQINHAKESNYNLKRKLIHQLPCRTSKRIAGITPDPVPDITMSNRNRSRNRSLQLVTVKSASTTLDSDKIKHYKTRKSTRRTRKVNKKIKGDKKEQSEEAIVEDDHSMKVLAEMCTGVKLGENDNSSLAELWSDPCIAFAIQTLTGTALDPTNIMELHSRKVDKADENPDSPLRLTYVDPWNDPCVDFAVKTLTDAVPVNSDAGTNDCHSQHMGSETLTALPHQM